MKFTPIFKLLTGIGLLVLAVGGFKGAWNATQTLWPGIHEDGSMYSTVIINIANNRGNRFDVYTFLSPADNENRSFNFHGQLYFSLLGKLLPNCDHESLLVALHSLNLAAYVLSFIVLFYAARNWTQSSLLTRLLFAVGGAYASVSVLNYLQGRPDHGVFLVLLIFALLRTTLLPFSQPLVLQGLMIGIVGGVSPLPGIYLGLFHAIHLALSTSENRRLFRNLTISALTAILTWLILTSLIYDGSVQELVFNTVSTGSYWNANSLFFPAGFPLFSIEWFARYWLILPFAPGLIAIYLFAGLILLHRAIGLFRSNHSKMARLIALILAYPLITQLWSMTFSVSAMNYTLLGLFPLATVFTFEKAGTLVRFPSTLRAQIEVLSVSPKISELVISPVAVRRWVMIALLVSCSIPGIGHLRNSILQPSVIRHGISFQKARQKYEEIKGELGPDEYVLINAWTGPTGRSAVVFDGPPWKMKTFNLDHNHDWLARLQKAEAEMQFKGAYFLYLQDRADTFPNIDGFQLVSFNSDNQPATLFGQVVRSVTPGFGYALYKRK